nr:hypothetical protein [Tanacetum cinerariifolium]
LREINEEVLVWSGLSSVWFDRKRDLIFRRKGDNSDQFRRKKRLRKRASEVGSSVPVVEQTKNVEGIDISNFCTQLENSLEKDEGTSFRVASAPPLQLVKRLSLPPLAYLMLPPLDHLMLVHPMLLVLLPLVMMSFEKKAEAEVMRHQFDPLNTLTQSALSRVSFMKKTQSPRVSYRIA